MARDDDRNLEVASAAATTFLLLTASTGAGHDSTAAAVAAALPGARVRVRDGLRRGTRDTVLRADRWYDLVVAQAPRLWGLFYQLTNHESVVRLSVALAALLSGTLSAVGHRSCAVISGGNVDPSLMDRLLQFGLGAAGRHLRFRTQLVDRPGALVQLSTIIAEQSANIFEVVHHRLGSWPSVNVVDLDLTLEVRDRAHGEAVLRALREAGYPAEVIRGAGAPPS